MIKMKIEKLEFEDSKRIEKLNTDFYEKLEKNKDEPNVVIYENISKFDLHIRNLDRKKIDGILKYLKDDMSNIKITRHKFNL